MDTDALNNMPKTGQLGFPKHHNIHMNYLQHRPTHQHSYQQYQSFQPHHVNYYQGSRSHPRPEKHAPLQINMLEETRLSLSKIRKAELLSYAPKFIEKMFQCDPLPPPTFPNQIILPVFLLNIMNRTRINTCTLAAAFFYLERLKKLHPRCKGSPGSGHRLLLAAVVVAAKYMYDDTFDNTAWATVSSGLFELEQVNHMEREMLSFLDFKLFIKTQEWYQFVEKLWLDMNESLSAPLSSLSTTLPNRSQNSSSSFSRQNSFSRQDSFRPSPISSSSTIIQEPYAPVVRQGWAPSQQQHAEEIKQHSGSTFSNNSTWLGPEDFSFQ